MEREIKFRFWHLKDEKMIDWIWITQNAWNSYRGDTPISLLFDFLTVKKDDVIIQQFTGLKDKNGNEIYEGDVLGGYAKEHPCGEYISYVVWNNEKAEWYLNKSYISGQRNLWRWVNKMEIIGNIYEHSNLIK